MSLLTEPFLQQGELVLGLLGRAPPLWSEFNEEGLRGAVVRAEIPVLPWETRFPRSRDGLLALPEELGPFSQLLNLLRVQQGPPQARGGQRPLGGFS